MKRFYTIMLCVVFLFMAACQKPSSEPTGSSTGNESDASSSDADSEYSEVNTEAYFDYLQEQDANRQKENEIMSNASERPYQQVITTTYSEKEAFEKGLVYYLVDRLAYASYFALPLSNLEVDFPVECLRRTSDKKAYVLYRTDDGGLVYCFLEDGASGNEGRWIITHSIYVKKSLDKSDFDAVKAGDSIHLISQIDPTVDLYLARWNQHYSQIPDFSTAHMLQDGIMVVNYEKKEGEYKVKSIEYFSNFIVAHNDVTYDCSILLQDCLQ